MNKLKKWNTQEKKWFRLIMIPCTLTAFLLSMGGAKAEAKVEEIVIDEAHFPDEEFRSIIKRVIDLNGNGRLETEEINVVTGLDLSSEYFISDLTGIEYFTALQHLDCSNDNLTVLDVSKNPTLKSLCCYSNKLTDLDVSQNPELEKLECDRNKLGDIDVSHNSALKVLNCTNCGLKSLDVSRNPALEELYCSYNNLPEVNISQNNALKILSCAFNSSSLKDLDLSNHPALTALECTDSGLKSLNVSGNPALEELYCGENGLTVLNVSANTNLKKLDCNDNHLTVLDVSWNTILKELRCGGNKLEDLDISKNTVLERLDCSRNSLKSLDLRQNIYLTSLDYGSQYPTAVIYPNNNGWQIDLAALVGSNNLSYVTVTSKDAVKSGNLVLFSGNLKPGYLTYTYNTGKGEMDVTVRLEDNTQIAPKKNTKLTDIKTKATYIVTAAGSTVEYTGTSNKKTTSVTIPATVTFDGITYKVTGIGASAFGGFTKLKKVTIGKNVTSIGAKAFHKCTSLTKITIPASVTEIGNNAFKNCKNLKTITIKSTKLSKKGVGKKAFKGVTKKTTIQAPKKKLKAYKKLLKQCGLSTSVKVKGK